MSDNLTSFGEMERCAFGIHLDLFCKTCWACKQVLREDRWAQWLYQLTFGLIDLRIRVPKAWARHQEIFNA